MTQFDLPPVSAPRRPSRHRLPWVTILGVVIVAHLVLLGWSCRRPRPTGEESEAEPVETLPAAETNAPPRRDAPARFPPDTAMPDIREGKASGSIHMPSFSPGRDLMYIDDDRVWWESDHDGETDDECDHTIHVKMEIPLRRVFDMVAATGAILKVQDTYRPTGIHNERSLHREGRAIDLTSDGLSLEDLAKICWKAGFDWIFYEKPRGGGDHIHASVRR